MNCCTNNLYLFIIFIVIFLLIIFDEQISKNNYNCNYIYFIITTTLIVMIYILSNDIETFDNLSDMLEFTKLDDSLIRRYKIGSSYNLYDSDINNLFKNDDVIRIKIPDNYIAKIIYKFKDSSNKNGFAKTIELNEGNYDINKTMNNKIIDQIIIKNLYGLNNNYIPEYPIYRPYYYRPNMFRPYYYRPYHYRPYHYRPYGKHYPQPQLF